MVIKNFDNRFDGVYKVNLVVDPSRFRITMYQNLQSIVDESVVTSSGLLYKLTSARINSPVDVESAMPIDGYIENDKVWVENLSANGNWGVYNKTSPWRYNSTAELDASKLAGNDNFGSSVSLEPILAQVMYVGSPGSGTGRLSQFARSSTNSWSLSSSFISRSTGLDSYGAKVVNGNGYVAVSAPDSSSGKGYVYIYKDGVLQQILTDASGSVSDQVGKSLAISRDGLYLYVGAPGANKVFCYQLKNRDTALQSLPTTRYVLTLQSSNVAVSVGDIITHANAGYMGTASATVVYNSAYNYTDTNVIVVSGNVSAFLTNAEAVGPPRNFAPFTSNIAINGANTAANISVIAVGTAIATYANLSVSSNQYNLFNDNITTQK